MSIKKLIAAIIVLAFGSLIFACSDGGYYIDEKYPQFPGNGSADRLEGRTAVVSVYVSDEYNSWDDSNAADQDAIDDSLEYLGIAANWISKQAEKYGSDAEFIYDWNRNPDLKYTADIDADLVEGDTDEPAWDFIYENIDIEKVMDECNAENIIFMFFVNTPNDNESTSCTSRWEDSYEAPYEICYIFNRCDDLVETPAAYAHEILHTFGAPDLYSEDEDGSNFGITSDYVSYCEDVHGNEIMLTTFDISSGEEEPIYDRISNDFTDITAYYVGLIDECPEIDEWGLNESQFAA